MSTAIQHIDMDGNDVSLKGEMVSLTGLWKAAGSDPSKAPAQWLRLSQAIEFIEHVSLIVGNSHDKLVSGQKRAGTYAHWHIAMAYARYLDPAFAVRCNEIVRAHMESRAVAPVPAHGISPDVLAMIRRTDGIARQLSGKVTKIEKALEAFLASANQNAPAARLVIEIERNGPEEAATSPSQRSKPRNRI
ncbi:KilA-N domain-containing protein [Consotaella salsifontis]|uniref:KilA-N domain-containing protein n=1 Tax=Consotaella salsifontis TaxID=1365950 RepID=A0A1T4R534_9HYPH|nr:KilA-N domain-containing protein [Consotaella salsifontis]SKA11162.1 KilA-N domain-containing protein [Consotaella salsifontis]